jgi:hypothetical protein
MSGNVLIRRLLDGDTDDSLPNELLKEIFAGFPQERLRDLLASDLPVAVKAAAWIMSELGPSARPLLQDAVPLLTHEARSARFFALDVVLMCADRNDGAIVAAAIRLIEDQDEAIQWKAMRFLTALPQALFAVAKPYLPERFHIPLDWLLESGVNDAFTQFLETQLSDSDVPRRRFAAVAAARLGPTSDLLVRAAESTDPVVRDFVQSLPSADG